MKVYGPYERKDKRKHVIIVLDDGYRKTISYPKYLMQGLLGRDLEEWETVDHINGDKTDDRLENLQLLSRQDNSKKAAFTREAIFLECPMCTKEFLVDRHRISNREKAGPFCSRVCAGKYGAEIQNSRMELMGNNLSGLELKYSNQEGKVLTKIL